VKKAPWNEEEEFVFIEAHKINGNKWSEIAKMIPGRYTFFSFNHLFHLKIFRTDNAIKNHFYSTVRRMISRVQKDEFPLELSKCL